MLINRIAVIGLCIVSTSAAAFGQQGSAPAEPVMRVIHTSLRPDLEGRLVPTIEVVETTRRHAPAATQTIREVFDFETAKTCDAQRFNRYFHSMLDRGIYQPPSQFEAAFISAAHTEADIDKTINAAAEALKS